MGRHIKLSFSVDHQKKKTRSVYLPVELYLHFVNSAQFQAILPKELKKKFSTAKEGFSRNNRFLSDDYKRTYHRNPFVRLVFGPDIHRFFAKVLSLNYQTHLDLLNMKAGSFEEYFSEWDQFWNKKYWINANRTHVDDLRGAIFCYACLLSQFLRGQEKEILHEKLDDFAKQELKSRELEILKLKAKIGALKQENETLKEEFLQQKQKNIVLVPSEPHYMLGLHPDQDNEVEKRSKILLKALHPDKSGSSETAYLFDMVLKARDAILKSD